jgi:hypothetical protein
MADRHLIENREAAVGVQMFHMRQRWGAAVWRAQTQVLLGRLKYALPGWEGAESRRAADTPTEASWGSHASGSGDGGWIGGDICWGDGYGGDMGRVDRQSRAAWREAQTPRLVGACERQARVFLGGALRCLACCESPPPK